MSRSFGVVFLERFARDVPTRFHAEEDQAFSIREDGARLPRGLVGNREVEILLAASIDVDACRFALRGEQ